MRRVENRKYEPKKRKMRPENMRLLVGAAYAHQPKDIGVPGRIRVSMCPTAIYRR